MYPNITLFHLNVMYNGPTFGFLQPHIWYVKNTHLESNAGQKCQIWATHLGTNKPHMDSHWDTKITHLVTHLVTKTPN